MNPEIAKKLAEMGDVKGNAQKLKVLIEKAKANPDHPDSVELRRRLERGMFNMELQALGKKPFPVQQPKINLGAAMAAAKPQIVEGASVQSRVPGQKSVMGIDADASMTGLKERLGDIKETFQATGKRVLEGASSAKEIASNKELTAGQRVVGPVIAFGSGLANAVSEPVIGAGKFVLSQEAEDAVKNFAQSLGEKVTETEVAKKTIDWYENLPPVEKANLQMFGGLANIVSTVLGFQTGKVTSGVAREVGDTAVDVAKTTFKQTAPVVASKVDDLYRPTEAVLETKIDNLFTKAVRPTVRGKETIGQADRARQQAVAAVRTINEQAPELSYVDEFGESVKGRAPESLKEFSQAIDQTKKNIFKQYNDLAKKTGEQGVTINPSDFADEFDTFINNKSVQVASPETVEYAKIMRDRYGSVGDLSPEDVENVIKIYNQDLQTFYRNPTADQGRKVAVDAMIVNNLRKQLDETIEKTTGAGYQELKNKYAALRSIEKDVLNATLRDARKNAAGLLDYTDILTGGDLVAGVLSMNPAVIGGAVAQRGIKSYFKYLNDPNVQIKKMFQTAEKLKNRPDVGYFERVVTGKEDMQPGLSIRNTVTPAKVGAQLSEREFDMFVEALDDLPLARTQPDFNELLSKYGLQNATDDELVKFIRQATDEFEAPGATERPVLPLSPETQ